MVNAISYNTPISGGSNGNAYIQQIFTICKGQNGYYILLLINLVDKPIGHNNKNNSSSLDYYDTTSPHFCSHV
jgi:hypothetical protein